MKGFWVRFLPNWAAIDEMARSLITGLLREGQLEGEGSRVRRAG
jgi:hypothetical protein